MGAPAARKLRAVPKFKSPRHIAVEGPLRVGKSSLARILADRTHARRVCDCDLNPFLDDFYSERTGAAFAAQMHFLWERHRLLREANIEGTTGPVISDFIFEKDKIFANITLDNEELKVYERYYEMFVREIPKPDLIIYLQASPEVLRSRIQKKGAKSESRISDEYVAEVVRAYEHFFFHYNSSDLLVVNTSDIDFVERNEDLQQLLRRLEDPIKGTQYFLPLPQE
ncbi:MAG TPA: deoxynucleoside kinase [Candidatus Acidoferrales bacterium]|nr:deoxynucleoside kinase [Candidatus Acidoferrales bacterium]